jgi:phosphatidylserine/phosphatidylglycerophosphate/cardiolipin synthase-like enzyme
MKIICESQKEYDELMKGNKYLHDLTWETRKGFKKEFHSVDMDNKAINFFVGLYLGERDFPNKNEVIIKEF